MEKPPFPTPDLNWSPSTHASVSFCNRLTWLPPRDEGAREMNDLREDMDEMSYLFDDSYVVVILREAMDMIRAQA
jgi:hypothetical protein